MSGSYGVGASCSRGGKPRIFTTTAARALKIPVFLHLVTRLVAIQVMRQHAEDKDITELTGVVETLKVNYGIPVDD